MALSAKYTVEMQSTRKILTVVDATSGWNTTGYELIKYCKWNPNGNTVILKVNIETKDKVYNGTFYLTTHDSDTRPNVSDIFGSTAIPITDPAQLRYMIALSSKGDLVIVSASTNVDDYLCIPDGIFTIVYDIYSDGALTPSTTYEETFVVTNGGEQSVLDAANKIADKILVCCQPDIANISDYLFKESLLFAANKAALISRKDRIINILYILNS